MAPAYTHVYIYIYMYICIHIYTHIYITYTWQGGSFWGKNFVNRTYRKNGLTHWLELGHFCFTTTICMYIVVLFVHCSWCAFFYHFIIIYVYGMHPRVWGLFVIMVKRAATTSRSRICGKINADKGVTWGDFLPLRRLWLMKFDKVMAAIYTNVLTATNVLASAVHILKLERYRED